MLTRKRNIKCNFLSSLYVNYTYIGARIFFCFCKYKQYVNQTQREHLFTIDPFILNEWVVRVMMWSSHFMSVSCCTFRLTGSTSGTQCLYGAGACTAAGHGVCCMLSTGMCWEGYSAPDTQRLHAGGAQKIRHFYMDTLSCPISTEHT